MTCIVAYRHEKTIYIGGDRLGSSGHYITSRKKAKIFIKEYRRLIDPTGDDEVRFSKKEEMGFGYTSSFRMGDIIEHVFKVPDLEKEMDEMKYMVSVFVPALMKCYDKNNWLKKSDDKVSGGTFIVAFNKRMFVVQDDFQICEEESDYIAVGCGLDLAKGAFYAMKFLSGRVGGKLLESMNPKIVVEVALKASMEHSAWVGGGFDIIEVN